MNNKLVNAQGLEAVLGLIKQDINSVNNAIDIKKLDELKIKHDKTSVSALIEDLYSQISNKSELPPFTVSDDGLVFGVTVENDVAKTGLINIEEKLKELITNGGDIVISVDWGDIKNKPLIASKLAFDNEGLKMLDSQNQNIHTLNALLTEQEIEDLLNKLN